MFSTSIPVHVVQHFPYAARQVFSWATDYDADDIRRMGLAGTRRIRRLGEDALILIDTFETPSGKVQKRRLIRIFRDRLFWTNTHLSGPNCHTQIFYQLFPQGRGACRLELSGRQMFYGKRPFSAKAAAALEKKIARDDAAIWKSLAREMAKDRRGIDGKVVC
jgi:hypothetical protein